MKFVGIVQKLEDGRILWMRPDRPVTLKGTSWVTAVAVSFKAFCESRPLSKEEISDLISSGVSFKYIKKMTMKGRNSKTIQVFLDPDASSHDL